MQAFEVCAHIGGALITQVAVFFDGLVDDALEFRRELGVQPDWCDRDFVEDCIENCRRRGSLKRQVAGTHFVEHHAEGEKIGARIEFFAQRLLRAHVRHRAQRSARRSELLGSDSGGGSRGGVGFFVIFAALGYHFRQTKIEDLGVAALGDEYIRRLDIAVNDAFGVRGVERFGKLNGQTQKQAGFERTAGDAVLQG